MSPLLHDRAGSRCAPFACPLAALGALGLIALSALSTSGCKKPSGVIPTEKMLVVRVANAPAIAEAQPSANAIRRVTWGEAYRARARQPDFKWTGPFAGQVEQRTGLVEVVRRVDDAPRFAFEADLLEADVPTSAWLCSKLSAATLGPLSPELCAERLLRTVASEDTLLAYVPTWQPDSPLAELAGGVVHQTTLPALSELRVVAIDKRPVVLAWTHWIRAREWTGSTLVVLLLSPPLQRAGELSLTETDARDPSRVTYWQAGLEILADGLHVTGRRSVRKGASDEELSGTNVDERWTIGGDGKLLKR